MHEGSCMSRIPDSRRRSTGRHPEIPYGRVRGGVARDRGLAPDLQDIMRLGPPENGVARHNFATIDDAANTLGLTAERTRVARNLMQQVIDDAKDLLSITKSAREAGIPHPAVVEMLRRAVDLRRREEMEEGYLVKGRIAPVGTVKRRRDGKEYRKVREGAGGWEEVRGTRGSGKPKKKGKPRGKGKPDGPSRGAAAEEEPVPRPQSAAERNGKTPGQRFTDIKTRAAAAGKRIHGDLNDDHGHEHMDRLENQLKEHIGNGLSQNAMTDSAPEEGDPAADGAPDEMDPAAQAGASAFSNLREAGDRHAKTRAAMDKLANDMKSKSAMIYERVWHAVKHTAAEFPVAKAAIGKLSRGEKLSKHEMEAIVSVGSMIGTTAIVASSYGTMAGGAVISQKFLTHVAMAALSAHLNTAYTAYAAVGFVKKLAHVAEGYVHGGVGGAAYHAVESAVHKADDDQPEPLEAKDGKKPDKKPGKPPEVKEGAPEGAPMEGEAEGAPEESDAEMEKLVKGVIKEMQAILQHDWTPDEIEAAEGGDVDGESGGAAPGEEGSDEAEEGAGGGADSEGAVAGGDDAPARPEGHDAPEQPHEQHRQTQEVHDLTTKLAALKPRLDSAHQKGMFKELTKDAATVTKDPSPQAIEWLGKRIDSFTHLVTGISGDDDAPEENDPVEKALLARDGRILIQTDRSDDLFKAAGGGWQNIPGGKHGGKRRRKGAGWEYMYGSQRTRDNATAFHQYIATDPSLSDASRASHQAIAGHLEGSRKEPTPTTSAHSALTEAGATKVLNVGVRDGAQQYTFDLPMSSATAKLAAIREHVGDKLKTLRELGGSPGTYLLRVDMAKGALQAAGPSLGLTRGIGKAGDTNDARGTATATPANEEETEEERQDRMRFVIALGDTKDAKPLAPVAEQPTVVKSRRVPPPPPERIGISKARAPHPINEHGHRDDLEPGMILHPRDRHEAAGPIEVMADGQFKVGDVIVKGSHALMTRLHGSPTHRTTARRYFKLGGERQAIPRVDVTEQLRTLLKSEGVLVQRAGTDYHLTGDLRKAGVPDYMMTTGDSSATIGREAAFDLCRLLGANNG